MNLTYLEHFQTIARCENMARAAEILHVSQPALSYSLSRLEEELGVKLFDREKKRIKLNEAGKRALEYTDAVFADIDNMKDFFRTWNSDKVILRIASSSESGSRNLIPRFMLDEPEVQVQTITTLPERIEEMILDSKCDVAISTMKISHDTIRCVFYRDDNLYAALPAGHRLKKRKDCAFSAFKQDTVVVPNANTRIIHAIKKLVDSNKINMTLCDDYVIYKTLCRETDQIFFLSELGIPYYKQELEGRTLIRVNDEVLQEHLYIAYSTQKKKQASILLEWLLSIKDGLISQD